MSKVMRSKANGKARRKAVRPKAAEISPEWAALLGRVEDLAEQRIWSIEQSAASLDLGGAGRLMTPAEAVSYLSALCDADDALTVAFNVSCTVRHRMRERIADAAQALKKGGAS